MKDESGAEPVGTLVGALIVPGRETPVGNADGTVNTTVDVTVEFTTTTIELVLAPAAGIVVTGPIAVLDGPEALPLGAEIVELPVG